MAALAAILELACGMSDPAFARSASDRLLGLQLISAILDAGGGAALRQHEPLRRLLMRESSRAVLRAVGSFSDSPSFISAAFNVACKLVFVLEQDGAALLTALLHHVFPYYISGVEGLRPMISFRDEDGNAAITALLSADARPAGSVGAGDSSRSFDGELSVDGGAVGTEIDGVVREIGLEALCSLVSVPGLLTAMYRVTDCKPACDDIVSSLLLALGGATKSRLFRRRGKRLRASSGGSGMSSSLLGLEGDSDEDDDDSGSSPAAQERTRRARSAALLCAEALMVLVDTIGERIKERADNVMTPAVMGAELADTQKERLARERKRSLQRIADAFNSPSFNAKNGLKVMELLRKNNHALDMSRSINVEQEREADVTALVEFFRGTPGLNKEKIGVVLGEPDAFSQSVLAGYTATFEFSDRPFTECLRIFLESFRLPGESQKIDRIVQSFATRYFEQNSPDQAASSSHLCDVNPSLNIGSADFEPTVSDRSCPDARKEIPDGEQEIVFEAETGLQTISPTTKKPPEGLLGKLEDAPVHASQGDPQDQGSNFNSMNNLGVFRHSARGVLVSPDAAYVLSYAVVMLNTDQHNASIRKKMTLDDFVRNNRQINGGKDLPRWFLADIFESIAAVEIRMSDEAGIGALTDLHWDEQLREMSARQQVLPSFSAISTIDEDLFSLCWPYVISAAAVTFFEAADAGTVQRSLEAMLNVARCAAIFRRSEPTDAVIVALAAATAVQEGPLYGAVVRFGTDIKSQMASVALSMVSRQCGDWMRAAGWQALVSFFLRLHALGLLPDHLEATLGGYGNDITGIDGAALPESVLVPSWWPSRRLKNGVRNNSESEAETRPRKQPMMNNFLRLFIGSDARDSDYESDDDLKDEIPPLYTRMSSAEDSEAEELARKCVAGCRIEDILINEAKVLRSDALACLARALSGAAMELLGSGTVSSMNGTVQGYAKSENQGIGDSNAGDTTRQAGSPIMEPIDDDREDIDTVGAASVISGTARMVRSSGSSVENDVDMNGFEGSSTWTGRTRQRDERKARDSVVGFCIDALCELTLQNRDRLNIPWPSLHRLLLRVIDGKTRSKAVLERAAVALLRVATRLLHRTELHSDVLRGLNLLVNLPPSTAEDLSIPVAAGVYNTLKTHGAHVSSVSGWHAILSIIENSARYSTIARDIGLYSLSFLLTDEPSFEALSAETFAPLLDAVLAYVSCSSVDVSMNALDLLIALSRRIPKLAAQVDVCSVQTLPVSSGTLNNILASPLADQRETGRAWNEYWGPLLRGFVSSVRDPRGKVRNHALHALERVVATGGTAQFLTANQWKVALLTILFPAFSDLFTTNGFLKETIEAERSAQLQIISDRLPFNASTGRSRRSTGGLGEHDAQLMKTVKAACDRTRLRAVFVISKTFLQHHACMAAGLSDQSFTELWLGVLGTMREALDGSSTERSLSKIRKSISSQADELKEHVPESIKNMLLVMCSDGLLDKEKHKARWEATFLLLKDFLPEMEESINSATNPSSEPIPVIVDMLSDGAEIESAKTGAEEQMAAGSSCPVLGYVDTSKCADEKPAHPIMMGDIGPESTEGGSVPDDTSSERECKNIGSASVSVS
jgi:Sec7 domain